MEKTFVLKPRQTEKTYGLSARNVYVFDVPTDVNKHSIARAVAVQFDVVVEEVNTVTHKGKAKRTVRKGGRASQGRQSDTKKAYITLKEGNSIPVFAAVEEAEARSEKLEAAAAKAAEKAAKKEKK